MANVNPTFYSEGHTPVNHNSAEIILQKILGAIIDQTTGSGGGGVDIGTVDQGLGGVSAWLVTAASLPLPSGASTAANQTSQLTALNSIDGKIVHVDTGAVVVSSSALPSGASTSALQTTGNTSLSSIDTKTLTAGQKSMANSSPIVIASDQSAVPVSGTVTATNASIGTNGAAIPASSTQVGGSDGTLLRAVSVDTTGKVNVNNISGTVSLPTGASTSALQTTGNTSLSSIDGKLPSIGTHVIAASVAVNVASDQVVPVSASALPLPTGAATSALQTTGNTSLSSIDGKLVDGHGTAAAALRVELPTDGTGVIATVSAVTAITNALPTGTNSIGTVQIGNTPNTTPILATPKDPAATTGNITAVDAATTTTTNSINQSIITGTPTANSSVSVTVTGFTVVTLQLSGTATTTCAFERSVDGGTTFVPFSLEELAVGSSVSSLAMSDNKAYVFRSSCGGMTTLRVRCTAYTSGTVAVKWQPSYGVGQFPVNQGVAQSIANKWPVQVTDGTNTMPTGDASARTIHTTIDNATIAIGNVATIGTSVTPGTAATNLGKAEDSASADGDVGVAHLTIRKAAPANTSGTDGDYEFMQIHAGRLWTYSLMTPGTSYALTTATSSATQALTAGTKAITIYARTQDAYIKLGTGAQTASSSTVYMAAGERLDVDMSSFATPNIGYIWGAAATAGVLQVSELT